MGFLDNIKDVVSVVQKADNIDLYKKLLDLQKDAMDLEQENYKLKQKIKELEETKHIGESLQYKGHNYYIEKNGTLDGPYCSVCWDKDKKLIRMHISNGMGYDKATCHVCEFSTSYIE